MDAKKTMKKAAAGTAMAGAFGFAMIGLGNGISLAKPNHPGPNPPGPSVSGNPSPSWHGAQNGTWNRSGDEGNQFGDENGTGIGDEDNGGFTGSWNATMEPGLNPFGPPGQVMHMPTLTLPGVGVVANPFFNVPPGQWRTINPANITWVPPTAPAGTLPTALTFDASTGQWGVNVNGTFYAYPIQFGTSASTTVGTS